MNLFKKITSIVLSALIVASGSTVAYAKNTRAENIQFNTLSQEEMQKDALEEKGNSKITLFENSVTEFDIVIPDECSAQLKTAVNALQEALEKITCVKIDTVKESSADFSKKNILIDKVQGAELPDEDIGDG